MTSFEVTLLYSFIMLDIVIFVTHFIAFFIMEKVFFVVCRKNEPSDGVYVEMFVFLD